MGIVCRRIGKIGNLERVDQVVKFTSKIGIACVGVAERTERSLLRSPCEIEAMCRCG